MMAFRDHLSAHLRLTMLEVLAEASEYAANNSVLLSAVESVGLRPTKAQVRGELAWLAEAGLVRLEEITPTLVVATLTDRGEDVAAGRGSYPGIPRPTPKG